MATPWTERYPAPNRPDHPGPEPELDKKTYDEYTTEGTEWSRRRVIWNEYVRAHRRHRVAKAVDELSGQRARGVRMGPEDEIALYTALQMLDCGLVLSEDGEL